MATQILFELINNASLLIVLSFVYLIIFRHWGRTGLKGQVLSGILFGGVAVGVMLTPLNLLPGVVFDTRSVVISVGGLFGGPLVAAISFFMAGALRIWQGGAGALMGVLVSFFSAFLGTAYFFWKQRTPKAKTWPYLYGFGLVVHAVMLVCALALPGAMTWRVLSDISLPVIVIYPVASLLLCLLISDNEARIEGEKLLAESEKKYRRLVDTANEGILMVGPDFRTTFANQKTADMLGYKIEDMLGQDLEKFIYPDDRPAYHASMEKRRQGLAETYERRYLQRNGEPIWILASASPVLDDQGAYTGSFAMLTDISERKQAEEAMRANEERLHAILEASADPLVVYDAQGRVTFVNPAFTKVFGWHPQEVIGHRIPFVPEDQLPMVRKTIAHLFATGGPVTMDTKRLTKDGRLLSIALRAAGIPGESGEITGMVVNLTDVTQTKVLEAQLRQSQKMEAIGTLAGGIAHDFNNILGVIMGYAEMAQEHAEQGGTCADEMGHILQAAERARKLVRQILTFSRKAEANLRPLDLNQSLRHTVELLASSLPKMLDIQTHLALELEPVNADPLQIEQVLMNLATNAADAMPEGGRLVLETSNVVLGQEYGHDHLEVRPGRYVLLMVSDNGQGMTHEILEHIFDPFFTTKEVGKGTGLGLSTVYGIVKGHGGYIYCYSEPGLGTTFKIYLPVYQDQPLGERPETDTPQGLPGGSETLLLVDDEKDLRDLGRQTLGKAGYRVLTAPSAEEALEVYLAPPFPVDLVILDLGMPGMGGHNCLKEILRHNPEAKVIIASGYSANGQVKASLESGAAGYVAKPFRKSELLATVRSVLDRN